MKMGMIYWIGGDVADIFDFGTGILDNSLCFIINKLIGILGLRVRSLLQVHLDYLLSVQ